jgi:microcystin-dependent protein
MLSLVTDSNPGVAYWFPIVPTSTGGSGAHGNMHPFLGINFIIKL